MSFDCFQLTYGSFASSKEMVALPPFYRMVPAEDHQHLGIISLLKHFGWTWVGLFVVEGDQGEFFLQAMETLFSTHGICADFTRRIPAQVYHISNEEGIALAHAMFEQINFRKSRVFVIYGETYTLMYIWYFIHHKEDTSSEQPILVGKVWIITPQIDFVLASMHRDLDLHAFHGAIAFSIHSNTLPGFQEALQMLNPDWKQADAFLEEFWEETFDCVVPDPWVPYKVVGACTGKERLETLLGQFFEMQMTGHSYSIYSAVHAVAHALHALFSWRFSYRARVYGKASELQDLQPWLTQRSALNVQMITIQAGSKTDASESNPLSFL
ncbi:vomeronasal type-2 receptor 1-like [Varanus komodoensis]|uniref:vomeronasal type-2 receptor 1-like n=1 Tax=Varanus komodoensis TaxID=61221 RepID=UPI001CF7A6BF|nr:vomeronasal type-2 receptor 1-like [Varanus komodoensis]